eukprot:TRINITY_DN27325_c1_g1_i1.p1 TRINITY_DN27325_c1_g1~~TRINITY_DN27325_c1_g1_i1.p1  ORF type:complete len:353 (-),score=56.22 TRINITY_DN27325_c1_g1_i1:1523-2581(-)
MKSIFAVCVTLVSAGTYLNQKYKDELMLDLWTPPNYPCNDSSDSAEPTEPTPLVVHIYGGGWMVGSRWDVCQSSGCGPIVPDTAKHAGAAVLAMDYQLTATGDPPHPSGAHMPKQIRDVIDAVNWVLADAKKYNIDPTRVVCSGVSAGGHLCALLATYSTEQLHRPHGAPPLTPLRAALSFFAPTDILNIQADADNAAQRQWCLEECRKEAKEANKNASMCDPWSHDEPESPESLVGGATEAGGLAVVRANPTKYREIHNRMVDANPITFVSRASPPMFIRAGSCDPTVPHAQSLKLASALWSAGADVNVKIVERGGHNCQTREIWQPHIAEGTAWLLEQLGGMPPGKAYHA